MAIFLGIDNGGTKIKAGLYREDGTEIAVFSMDSPSIHPRFGFAERDMELLWNTNCQIIKGVLQTSGIDPHDITGVACCGHGKGLYLWGTDDAPVGNGILSTDNRAWKYPIHWRANGTDAAASQYSCQHIVACQPAPLLNWVEAHHPDAPGKTQWIFSCKDYIRFRLTGRAYAELTDCSGNGLLDLRSGTYSEPLLELLNISRWKHALPPLCGPLEVAGTITAQAAAETGLIEGTPVAGGMFDIDASALAAGIVSTDHLCVVAGTWSINEYISPSPVLDGSIQMNSLYVLPGQFLIEESSSTSAGNLEWFINTILPELKQSGDIYSQLNCWVEEIAPSEDTPVFLPFLMGSNMHPLARSALVGVDNSHYRAHVIRSIYEGIVFSHRFHVDKLLRSRTVSPKSLRLTGGAANSRPWVQMFADVMGLPVEVVNANETGTLGCAIAASVATGFYPDALSAVHNMCHIGSPVQPRPEYRTAYERKYQRYLAVAQALESVWTGDREAENGD